MNSPIPTQLDYNHVARAYHRRYESSPLTGLARSHHVLQVLDVGCGTGRRLEALAVETSTVGVDSSLEMLHQARVRLSQARLIQTSDFIRISRWW